MSSYTPKVFAHRGSNKIAPENSKAAFDLALLEGADGFETDIQFSKDSIPLLWHDDEMERIGMPLKTVNQYLWDELELLDISMLSEEFHRYSGLLRLEEFLNLYYKKVHLLLEIKEMNKVEAHIQLKNIKTTINRLLAASIAPQKLMISSFELPLLVMLNELYPKSFIIANTEKKEIADNLADFVKSYPFISGICLEKNLADKNTIEKAKELGLKSLVYTCNSPEEIKKALESKVDIIISDTPGECRKQINKQLSKK